MNDRRPELDKQAEHENGADNDGEPDKIGGAGRRLDVEAERVSEPRDQAADKAARTRKARDEGRRPGDDEEGHRDRQKGEHAREEDA